MKRHGQRDWRVPLVTWAVLVYASTLVVALSGSPLLRVVVGAGALVASLLAFTRSQRTVAVLSAISAAAVFIAAATLTADSQCRAQLAARHSWEINFDTDARDGEVARGIAAAQGCSIRATLIIASGHARQGQVATATGGASVNDGTMFIEDATLSSVRRGPYLAALRAAASRRIGRIFGSDAAMARALIIGDMTGIPADVRDRYARAGLVHMLSVSGLHVGIIALALEILALVMRAPLKPARIITLTILAAYVIGIGAPAPAVRAAVMLGALLLSRLLQRPTSKWAVLALGAGVPLIDPRVALDLGWQLSVAGTAALIGGGALAHRLIPSWKPVFRTLATGVTISIVATLATAPLVAWTFGRVALLGPLTNLLADPVMGLLQPVLFLGVVIPFAPVEHLTADASHALLAAFDAIARGAVLVPFAAPVAMPTVTGAIAAAIASTAMLVACCSRHWARPALLALGGGAVLLLEPFIMLPAGRPELHMLDVGQGDAFAIRTSRGRWIVVDAGRSWQGGDAGRSVVAPYIAQRGGEIALFVLSHPHADHVGGAASLFALRTPGKFLDPGYVGTSPPYRAALNEAMRDHIPWQRVRPGQTITVDDVDLTTLAPDSAWASALDDANLASSVLRVHMGNAVVLFTGDAEVPEEEWLLAHSADSLRADVLKVGHHGSNTSTSPAFLEAVRPKIALVSVGARNTYGHPSREIMEALRASGALIARTDQQGSVVLRFGPTSIDVSGRTLEWRAALTDNH
jgi:competence protein ComEC